MARAFNLLKFLRSAPNKHLEEYFRQKGLLGDFAWDGLKERDMEPLRDAITSEPEPVQDDVTADFQELHLRSLDGGFVKAILDEARFHGIDTDLPEQFEGMRSHLERAFWTFLHRRDRYWNGANVIWRVDKVTGANQWTSRPGLPQRPGPVDEGVVAELQQALIQHFSRHEARGRRCQIEAYRRDGEEIFYAFPEDYKKTVAQYVGDRLEPHTVQPAFEIIFRHVDSERRLDIHVEGDSVSPNVLSVIFASAVLKEEIDEEYDEARPTYDLQALLSRHFEFKWPKGTGIRSVAVKALRIKVDDDKWQRVTIEADPTGRPKAVYDLLEKTMQPFPPSVLIVDQASLSVEFRRGTSDRRTPTRTVTMTSPHTCRMVIDSRGEQIMRMLESSGIAVRDKEPDNAPIEG